MSFGLALWSFFALLGTAAYRKYLYLWRSWTNARSDSQSSAVVTATKIYLRLPRRPARPSTSR